MLSFSLNPRNQSTDNANQLLPSNTLLPIHVVGGYKAGEDEAQQLMRGSKLIKTCLLKYWWYITVGLPSWHVGARMGGLKIYFSK